MQTYKIILDASQIASTDPGNFTGAVIGLRLQDGFRSRSEGHVVELVEDGYHVLDCTSYRKSYRNEPCLWGNGTQTEIIVYALVAGPIGEEIDHWISQAREMLRDVA